MKRKIYFYMILLSWLLCAVACYDEKELSPSGIISSYSVPQGEHDYDDVIVEYYNKSRFPVYYINLQIRILIGLPPVG